MKKSKSSAIPRTLAEVFTIIKANCEEHEHPLVQYRMTYMVVGLWAFRKAREMHDDDFEFQILAQTCPLNDYEAAATKYLKEVIESN